MSCKKIVVLFHERNTCSNARKYSIVRMAGLWKDQGHEVQILYGTRNFVPADICFVNVDLTIVPDEYGEFARRYPVSVNASVNDIRKSKISNNLLAPSDDYGGKVIVKTDLNYAGWPEAKLFRGLPYRAFAKFRSRFFISPWKFHTSLDYRIYERLNLVPSEYFRNTDFVVEKFLPEMDGENFVTRSCLFMGDVSKCYRRVSDLPIVKMPGNLVEEVVDPHPEISRLRSELKLEYGKIDYALGDGRFTLYDINKTFTFANRSIESTLEYYFAESNALQSLFDRHAERTS